MPPDEDIADSPGPTVSGITRKSALLNLGFFLAGLVVAANARPQDGRVIVLLVVAMSLFLWFATLAASVVLVIPVRARRLQRLLSRRTSRVGGVSDPWLDGNV